MFKIAVFFKVKSFSLEGRFFLDVLTRLYGITSQKNVLKRVETLLCNDREISQHTRASSRQRLGKHSPAATDMNTTMFQQHSNGVFYVVRAEM
jgi:hypothetical protein